MWTKLKLIKLTIMELITLIVLLVVTTESAVENKRSVVQETILPNNPFVSIWNAPSEGCEIHFGVKLNLSSFDIVVNKGGTFQGDEIVIFYKLGLFPYYTPDGTPVYGGLPQLANVDAHLSQVRKDVEYYVPDPNFTGLAVIDWEAWRPIFERNHYNVGMRIYIQKSEELVRRAHPDWSEDKVKREAAEEFETAARMFMLKTITFCHQLRPGGKWGYYGFPECYNYQIGEKHCANRMKFDNDKLHWLFNNSGAILPSIYLSESHGTVADRRLQVFGSIEEALRVSENNSRAVIVPYSRFRYKDTGVFYQLGDLKNTIQQSVDAGMAGIALWDTSASFRTKDQCEATRNYLDSTLGPFVKNLTIFALNCSANTCHSHGRCVRRDWNQSLPVNPSDTLYTNYYKVEMTNNAFSFRSIFGQSIPLKLWDYITNILRKYLLNGNDASDRKRAPMADKNAKIGQGVRYQDYECRCYTGWSGEFCQKSMF